MAKSYRKNIHGTSPYYDDFDENKKFLRIMSRPGYPLQAREITQLQTIVQDQIERLSDHLFENGAVVSGGEITESSAIAIRLDNTTLFTEDQLKSFIGKTVSNEAGVKAVIISYDDVSPTLAGDNYQVLFVNYTTGNNFIQEDVLTIQGTLPLVQTKIKAGREGVEPPATSVASNVISIASGVFYADGFLVLADGGSIAASSGVTGESTSYRNFENPTTSIGYVIAREIVTSDDDETLKDPAFGFYNFNSPGADRYKIDLTLSQVALSGTTATSLETNEDFFEVVRIVSGQTTKQVRYTDYAILEDTLARRTYDESGHYTVSPFQVSTTTHSEAFGTTDENKHAIKVSAGKAYVNGYEFETIAPSYFQIDRAIGDDHLETLRFVQLNTPLKNYVTIDRGFDAIYGEDRITFQQQRKAFIQREEADGQVTNLGTCHIRTIQEMGGLSGFNLDRGEFRLSLWGIQMDSGNSFKDATHIAVDDGSVESNDASNRYRIVRNNNVAELKSPGSSRQIFKAPIGSALLSTNRDDLPSQFVVRKPYNYNMSLDVATVTSPFPFLDASRTNYNVWIADPTGTSGATMHDPNDEIIITINNNVDPKVLQLNLPAGSSLPSNSQGTVIATQRWQSSSTTPENNIRTKTVTDETATNLQAIDEIGGVFESIVKLPHPDVFEVASITDRFRDVTGSFELDPNHNNEAYFMSRVVLKPGFTCDIDQTTNKIKIDTINYKRFSHSGEGPFTVDSYPITDTFTYDNIPIFTDTETGEQYSLADAFDFRPVAIDSTEKGFDNGSGSPQVVVLNTPAFSSYVSYDHYLSRIDRLVIGIDRQFRLVKGIPAVVPVAPQTTESQMVLGEFLVSPYTRTPDNIKYRYIDNQRTTMSEINELEKAQQYDQYWSFVKELEVSAITETQNFIPEDFVVSDGILVDTFIGHNNAITAKRDHNCSIDPEEGTLRPAFESSFHHMGLTAADLGGETIKTSDGIYMLDSVSADYSSQQYASDTINGNQFGVPDFLGTLSLNPTSDPYFSTIIKPKVMVNAVGEVDNWESNVVAYQRGRTRGFGSQWRDWETIWFGSKKRNDIGSVHVSSGSDYSAPRRASFVSRILSDKLIRKIGNKIVDLSIIPYARSRTISFVAKNLKPDTDHRVQFDGVTVASLVRSNGNGVATGSFDIPRNTFLTGKKLVRITDNVSIVLATSSADATYYAEGLLETRTGDIHSVRPAITRRKSSNSEDVSSDYIEANAVQNLSQSFNSQTPLAQELYVDPTNFPNGIMLKNIVLFFASKPEPDSDNEGLPIKLAVRPLYNGAPHPYKVLPFSEVTKDISDIVVSTNYAGSIASAGTTFEFSTPVYLKAGTSYAICLSTNSPDYTLYMGVENSQSRGSSGETTPQKITKPRHIGPMHLPSNNGSVYSVQNQFFKMYVNRCNFTLSSGTGAEESRITFTTTVSQNKPFHALYVHNCEQVSPSVRTINTVTAKTASGTGSITKPIDFNETVDIEFADKYIIRVPDQDQLKITSRLIPDDKNAVSPMIDGERFGVVAVEYMANNDDGAATVEETYPNSRIATNRSKYVSRKVTLDQSADGIAVIVTGSFVGDSQIKVFVKTQGEDAAYTNFDDNSFVELYPEGRVPTDGSTKADFAELKPSTLNPGTVRFTRNDLGSFTQYQIKIVLLGQNTANTGNASQVPIIQSIAAVPVRQPTQDVIRRYIPSGSVMMFGGASIPSGFLPCDGTEYNSAEYPDLFAVIGRTYGGSEANGTFNVPDMSGRVSMGVKSSGSPSFALGDNGGVYQISLSQANLPPHTHRLEPPTCYGNPFKSSFVTTVGNNGEEYTSYNNGQYHYRAISTLSSYNGSALTDSPPFYAGTGPAPSTMDYRDANLNNPDIGPAFDTNADQTPMTSTPIDNKMPYLTINYIIKT